MQLEDTKKGYQKRFHPEPNDYSVLERKNQTNLNKFPFI